MTDSPSIHDRIAAARQQLGNAAIDSDDAALDARVLAEHVLGWDAARLLTDGTAPAPAGFLREYDAAIARRIKREPVAYITGTKEFWNLTFAVSNAVLIPRPETEGIIEQTLKRFPDRHRAWRFADVCTGSGCLAVVLASEYLAARVTATDISPAALVIARRNVDQLGVSDGVTLLHDDLLTHEEGPFDLIVANPPYVTDASRIGLQPEVAYEPALALFAGDDGLSVIRRLLDQAASRLAPGGLLMFEFGFGQDAAIRELISTRDDLKMLAIEPDFSGIPRIAIARRTDARP